MKSLFVWVSLLSAQTPASLKVSWARAHLALILIIIVVVGAAAGGGTYYILSMNRGSTIFFYESLAPPEVDFFQHQLVPQFEAANPGTNVILVNLSGPDDTASVVEALVKGNSVGPSLVGIDNLVVGEVIYANAVTDLSPMLSNIEPSSLITSAQKMIAYEQQVYGGATYFVPFRSNVPLVWYNITAFTRAGINLPPANTTQLLADAAKLKTVGYSTPIMFQGGGRDASAATELYQWMVQFGGNPFMFNDTGDVATFQYLQTLSQYFDPGYINGYWGEYTGLYSGSYQLLDYQWPYIYSQLTNATYKMTDKNLGVYPGPAGPSNSNHVLGGDVLVIPKGATNLPLVEKFAKFLLDSQAQTETLLKLAWVAVNSAAYNNLPGNFSTVGNALLSAIDQGVFLRNPAPWISTWDAQIYDAWTQIVEASPQPSPSQVHTILNTENQHLYDYLVTNYSTQTAQQYEQNAFKPISVS